MNKIVLVSDDADLASAIEDGLTKAGVASHKRVGELVPELATATQQDQILLVAARTLPHATALLPVITQARSAKKPVVLFAPRERQTFDTNCQTAALLQGGAWCVPTADDLVETACAIEQLGDSPPKAVSLHTRVPALRPAVSALAGKSSSSRALRVPEDIPLVGAARRLTALRQATRYLAALAKPLQSRPVPPKSARAAALAHLDPLESTLTDGETKALCALYGISAPAEEVVFSPSAAAQAARHVGFPVALRVVTPDARNLADLGAVATGVQSGAEARGAYARVLLAAHENAPQARLEGVAVAKSAPAGPRVRLSAHRHKTLGAALVILLAAEPQPLTGQPLRLCPLTVAELEQFVLESPVGAFLQKADLRALALLGHKFSLMAWDLRDALEEIDLLVVVRPKGHGCVVVEASGRRVDS